MARGIGGFKMATAQEEFFPLKAANMKKVCSIIGLTSLSAFFVAQTHAEWSLISILRGEPAAPMSQRVAFVGSATVRQVTGQVERLSGIDSWSRLRNGEVIAPGDVIRTRQGNVVLKMARTDSFVRVADSTVLRLVPAETGLIAQR